MDTKVPRYACLIVYMDSMNPHKCRLGSLLAKEECINASLRQMAGMKLIAAEAI